MGRRRAGPRRGPAPPPGRGHLDTGVGDHPWLTRALGVTKGLKLDNVRLGFHDPDTDPEIKGIRWGVLDGALAGQTFEYATLIHEGLSISTNAYGSVFFLATGFHGLHVTGGLIAFLFVLGRTFLARTFTHEQAVTAVVVSYYWHFVDIVLIALFGVIYLLR